MNTVNITIPAFAGEYKEVSVYVKSFVTQKMRDLGLEVAESNDADFGVNAYSLMEKDMVACVKTPGNPALIHELFEAGSIAGFYISTDNFEMNFGYSESNIAFAVTHYLKEISRLRNEMIKEIARRDEQLDALRAKNYILAAQIDEISKILYQDDYAED